MQAKCPFPHSPRIRKWEPPVGKAAPPLGEKPFAETFRDLRVLAQKMLKLLGQQELSGLGKAENKSGTKKQNKTWDSFSGMSQSLMLASH